MSGVVRAPAVPLPGRKSSSAAWSCRRLGALLLLGRRWWCSEWTGEEDFTCCCSAGSCLLSPQRTVSPFSSFCVRFHECACVRLVQTGLAHCCASLPFLCKSFTCVRVCTRYFWRKAPFSSFQQVSLFLLFAFGMCLLHVTGPGNWAMLLLVILVSN